MSFPSGLVIDTPALVGRIGGVFNALSVSGLVLWLDASRITGLADGAAVAQWNDSSGAGKHAVQASGTVQPVYKTGILNGRSVVRFDGGDCLQSPTPAWGSTTAFTVFTVFTPTVAATNYVVVESGDGLAGAGKWFASFRTTANDVRSSFNGDVGATECRGGTLTTASAMTSTVIDTSLAVDEVSLWLNGVATTTRAANTNNTNGPAALTLNIGARSNGTSLGLVGDIAEILIYARALTTTERTSVERSLRTKWGTP